MRSHIAPDVSASRGDFYSMRILPEDRRDFKRIARVSSRVPYRSADGGSSPLARLREYTLTMRQASLHATDCSVAMTSLLCLDRSLTGRLLRGCLVVTSAGLPPASGLKLIWAHRCARVLCSCIADFLSVLSPTKFAEKNPVLIILQSLSHIRDNIAWQT